MTRKYLWLALGIAALVILWKIVTSNKAATATFGAGTPTIGSSVLAGVGAIAQAGLGWLNSRDSGSTNANVPGAVDNSSGNNFTPDSDSNAGDPANNI